MPPDKPHIDRAELERDGMIYFEGVFSEGATGDVSLSLPAHVEPYRQALLDFSVLGRDCSKPFTPGKFLVQNLQHNPASLFSMTKDGRQQMDHYAGLSKRARDLTAASASDREWESLLEEIFKEYKSVSPGSRDQQEKNILWDDTKKYAEKCPKPNFTYGYPIVRDIPIALRSAEPVTNFSLAVLGDLRSAGLISSPLGSLHEWTKDKFTFLSPEKFICFPWAVVEIQSYRPFSFVYSYAQAANGALAALRLNEELSKFATGSYDPIPPVVAFTCVGSEIRVWLAYSEINHGHKMVCIWQHSLSQDRGVLETCVIVENMLLWASRVWKPKISGYISRIRQSNPALFSLSHVPKPTILSLRISPFEPSAKSTQPKPAPPMFVFGAQRPSRPKASNPDPASSTSIFTSGEQHLSAPKGNDQDPGVGKYPPAKLIANTAEGSIKDERRRRKPIVRLPKVKYDEIRESKQKQENDTQRSSRADPATDTIITTEEHTTHNILGNAHRLGLDPVPESAVALEKLSERINSLDLDKSVQTAVGNQSTGNAKSSQASNVTVGGTDKEDRDNPPGEPRAANLEKQSRTTSAIDSSDPAVNSDSQSKQGDGTIEEDLNPLTERSEHNRPHPPDSAVSNDDNSLRAGSSKLDVREGREVFPENNEEFQGSPDEPELMIGTCPHYGSMVAESLQLLWGDELLRLEAVSKIILELQGQELLDVTWSVLELWVAQHSNVPSPCGALDKIIRELNDALGSPDNIITPEQMWASEPGTWENIDKALQSILKSGGATLRNILEWAIECMDLLEDLELCHILKLGELSCLELKRMDQEIIDNMLAEVTPRKTLPTRRGLKNSAGVTP
ncbi:hypothetical protein EMPG_16867 [Blastomyces silverae]|uniref:Uncharacterized protein n=1 Tax=Blastomyces silverae TaxID=2060906 RepID=A0A0H1B987_9EURO|nr:hypothetical protein EMPG_16867 [Blastomyces silverae]